jgi:hypothetical protein
MKFTSFIKKHPWLLAKSLLLLTFFTNILVACLKKSMLVILDLKGKDPNWEPPPPPPPPSPPKRDCQTTLTGLYVPEWLAPSFKEPYKYHPVLISRVAFEAKQKAFKEAYEKSALLQVAVTPEPTFEVVDVSTTQVHDFSQQNCPCSLESDGLPIVIDNSTGAQISISHDGDVAITGNSITIQPLAKPLESK